MIAVLCYKVWSGLLTKDNSEPASHTHSTPGPEDLSLLVWKGWGVQKVWRPRSPGVDWGGALGRNIACLPHVAGAEENACRIWALNSTRTPTVCVTWTCVLTSLSPHR